MRAELLACGLALSAAVAFGCSDRSPQVGTGEPFRVRYPDPIGKGLLDGQFVQGPLPGTPPLAEDAGEAAPPSPEGGAAAGASGPPELTPIELSGNVYFQGQGNRVVRGLASLGTYSVGLRFEDLGDGYWVIPVGAIDTANSTPLYTWEAHCDFASTIPAGYHELRAVGFDEHGVAGVQQKKDICIGSLVPDNFNSCEGSIAPPQAVISLTWDTNADVDLQVLEPGGRLVEPKDPTTVEPDGGPLPRDVDGIDRDSNAGCAIDGIRTENLVWHKVMPHGRYGIYVNLFDACKQPAVRFEVEVYTSVTGADGGRHLHRYYSQVGELLDISANGGSGRGLFVTEFIFK